MLTRSIWNSTSRSYGPARSPGLWLPAQIRPATAFDYRNEGVQWLRLRWGRMIDDWVLEDTIALQRALNQLQHAA